MYIQILDLNTFTNQLNHKNTENHISKYFLDISKFLPVCSSRTVNQKLSSYCPDHLPPHTRLFSSSITFSGIDIIFSLDTEYLLKKTKSKKTLVSSSLSNQSQILILRSLKSGFFFLLLHQYYFHSDSHFLLPGLLRFQFIQQMFIKYLPCVRHYSYCWG